MPEYIIEFIIAVLLGIIGGFCLRIHRYIFPVLIGITITSIYYDYRDGGLDAIKPDFTILEITGVLLGIWIGENLMTKLTGREYFFSDERR